MPNLYTESNKPTLPLGVSSSEGLGAGAGAGNLRVLHLTLKRQWFDMIASGVKREEYRAMKPYWHKRLNRRSFDAVHFRNGYSADAPAMLVELRDIGSGLGLLEWGAPLAQSVYILRLGAIMKAPNVRAKTPSAAQRKTDDH
jgi:hypothetical protein